MAMDRNMKGCATLNQTSPGVACALDLGVRHEPADDDQGKPFDTATGTSFKANCRSQSGICGSSPQIATGATLTNDFAEMGATENGELMPARSAKR